MPPPEGPQWEFFHKGPLKNKSQHEAYCLGCIRHHRQVQNPPNDTDAALKARLEALPYNDAGFAQARAAMGGHVRGEKSAMIAHIIGSNPCPYTSAKAKKTATTLKNKGKAAAAASDSEEDEEPNPKRRKLFQAVEKVMKQPELVVYRGANIPFSKAEIERVREQFLRATVSANLPFRWVEDGEIIKLFIMFRSTACDVIPSRDVLSGTLLDAAWREVEKQLQEVLNKKTDGWKDPSKNPLTGVNLSTGGKSYLVDLIQSNGHKKDGKSMCTAFLAMIDAAEQKYHCAVILFVCDNDGGSQRGRKDAVIVRPWLLVAPCCAHQGQLILADYFRVNEAASDIAEQATTAIYWIVSHDGVKKIFDDIQFKKCFVVLVYVMANMTRWTTHYLAFRRLLDLKIPIRFAAMGMRAEILEAQLGAEKNAKAIKKITAQVNEQCDLLESIEFWSGIQTVVNDIEPICYATNINQSDTTRLDQVLLTFAGLYRHFSAHKDPVVAKGMMERIEKRWRALDQSMFVIAMVLNPYECLERFGDKAGLNAFNLNTELLTLYRRIRSRPRPRPRPEGEDARAEKAVSAAFMHYLSGTGDFASWNQHKASFQDLHPDEPHLMWEQMKTCKDVSELAGFAIMLLDLVVNQASNERSFSDLKIKKTALRNRLGTKKLEKIIRTENMAAGLVKERTARENHQESTVPDLLNVPRYADALEDDEDEGSARPSKVIKSAAAWRVELKKWIKDAQEEEAENALDTDTDDDTSALGNSGATGRKAKAPPKLFPRSLNILFGGVLKKPVGKPRREQFTREVLLMELLAAEESDEELDDGALSGSGDEFEE
ncbi:ribonuclease H-like domain-containing protein [Mycena alexandri]|uniref:Ribonuclease H-like domain-containing protein n=1 Tax=Mycena alexandri TaxID=1745969 RepID=A0AAD6WUX4_9AGAR|nr:ribonuclease H-like domain-containing protein [Mycena alexandri]